MLYSLNDVAFLNEESHINQGVTIDKGYCDSVAKSNEDFSNQQNWKNIDISSCIGLSGGGKLMLLNEDGLRVEPSQVDLSYIRNAIATGIANYIVEKVSKSTESSIDNREYRRYSPCTDRKECDSP